MNSHADVCARLRAAPRRFLVTGVAGFIGSHLLKTLLELDQTVVGLDNFATGSRDNLSDVLAGVTPTQASRFRLVEGDVRDLSACARAMQGVEIALHEAALPSVPRSMVDPMGCHSTNVDGFVNVLLAARTAGVERVVYASSSAVYGDDESVVKVEERIGRPLSPYAATKLVDEIYADTFRRTHGVSSVGLRYFNVFGPRQDPDGAYAAVVPRWIEALLHDEPCVVFGDGSASRDFCFVDNVVQANLLAACVPEAVLGQGIFNVGCGVKTTLLELFAAIRSGVTNYQPNAEHAVPRFEHPRVSDVAHSRASIYHTHAVLGYEPSHDIRRGIDETIAWAAAQRLRSPRAQPRSASNAVDQARAP